MKNFHNTASETGAELKDCEEKAAKQEKKILDLFISNPDVKFISDEVHSAMRVIELKTSTRRAISNLKRKGRVIDTGERRKGEKNRNQIVWSLKSQSNIIDEIKIEENRKAKFHRKLLALKKDYLDLMDIDLVICIDLETT